MYLLINNSSFIIQSTNDGSGQRGLKQTGDAKHKEPKTALAKEIKSVQKCTYQEDSTTRYNF